ncbi:MAG: LysM peptidoglycan-binding domain-containing protein, partial [Bacillota bacterium]|nr:LysM peptidoglycan-binding domain-containing protein [Bacillota bacterium]
MIIHVVNPGDTIYMISKQYGVEENKIIHDNQLSDPNKIIPNQTLIISNDEKQHRVKFGETLHSIAITYNVSIEDLMKENPQIKDPNKIEAESIITIPTSQKKQITVNGYAYPTENLFGVMNALSSLSSLSVFGYQVGADGSLSNIQDSRIIQVAEMAGVIPRMVITNISDNGSFDSNIAHEILNSEQIQNTLLDNILQVMKQKDYKGLNIDFEFVYPADKEKYNNFLKKAADRLHENGYLLYTSLPPKISGDQSGLLYEAQDYPTQGKIADKVILMKYDGYGPPSPIAPIRFIKSVLD